MKDAEIDRWPFAILMCVCLGGLLLKSYALGHHTSPLDGAFARTLQLEQDVSADIAGASCHQDGHDVSPTLPRTTSRRK